jgi:hypothetical protein
MTADKIGKISMFSDFNENWYLGLFWSEELIGNDENCIQGHFYDATVSNVSDKLFTEERKNNNNNNNEVWLCLDANTEVPISEFGHVDARFIITNQSWKTWTYVKLFDLTYIGNWLRDFYMTWHIY